MEKLEFTSIARTLNPRAAGLEEDLSKAVASTDNSIHGIMPIKSGFGELVKTLMHTEDNGDLEKGCFADTFKYVQKYDLPIRKTGKEMAESLTKVIRFMESEKAKCYQSLGSLLNKCKTTPTAKPSNYMTSGVEHKIGDIPNMFTYNEMSSAAKEANEMSYINSPMHKYNEEVRKYLSVCVDLVFAQTMKDGISEDREYTLSIKQAAAL